jgi:hypothetical protein
MAKIKKEILGKVRGSLGDITFRERNGKSYLATRPGSFIPGSDPASRARRDKFRLSIKLAHTIYSLDELKNFWQTETPADKIAFNYITQVNYPLIGSSNMSGLIRLVPNLGFNLLNPASAYNQDDITVSTDPLGTNTGIDIAVETSLKLVSVIYLSDPLDNSIEDYSFLKIVSGQQATVLDQQLSFVLSLSNIDKQLLEAYQNHKGYYLLITLDADGNVVRHSNTFSD